MSYPRDFISTNVEAAAYLAREAEPPWDIDEPFPDEYEDLSDTEDEPCSD